MTAMSAITRDHGDLFARLRAIPWITKVTVWLHAFLSKINLKLWPILHR